jgi:hypothetical protein
MGSLKAPCPDGFPARFYQRHWDIVSKDVMVATQKFFCNGVLPEGVYDTAIILIPKGSNPGELKEFLPISLCNMIYKLITKCIINRLQGSLDEIISPEQSAFVPSRRISDNAIIAFECVHEIKRNNGRRGDFYAYKVDLSKAYDRVDWGFLRCVLEKLGFHQKFIQWVMMRVTSVQYCVHFNGTDFGPFRPS